MGNFNLEVLKETELELKRTLKKVQVARKDAEQEYYNQYRSYSFASAKRAALDCKFALTKLTQSTRCKWQR